MTENNETDGAETLEQMLAKARREQIDLMAIEKDELDPEILDALMCRADATRD